MESRRRLIKAQDKTKVDAPSVLEDGSMHAEGFPRFALGDMGAFEGLSEDDGGVPSEFETDDLPSITDDLADFVKRVTNNY